MAETLPSEMAWSIDADAFPAGGSARQQLAFLVRYAVLALMIFYVNSSGYTEAVVMPGVYFFAASALITMLAYGWAHTVPARPAGLDAPRVAAPIETPPQAGAVVTLPTNPGRRHRPLSKGGGFGPPVADAEPL